MTAAPSAMGLLYTTWPDAASAEAVAEALLNAQLIACANIMGGATSLYRWRGAVERSTEVIALFKTSPEKAVAVRDRIAELHPYDEPAILELTVGAEASSSDFLKWVNSETLSCTS